MPTYTSQPSSGYDKQIESAGDNTYVDNYMGVGESNDAARIARSLIKFEDLSSIPSNTSVVSSATLSIVPITDRSDNNRTLGVYIVKRNWVLAQATWSVYSTGNNWEVAGAAGANDIYTTPIGTASISSSQTLNVAINISLNTDEIKKMINGTYPNYGFLLAVDTQNNDRFHYATSRHATASYRPKLVIEYEAGGAGHNMTIIGV